MVVAHVPFADPDTVMMALGHLASLTVDPTVRSTKEAAWELAKNWNNERLEKPWSEDRLRSAFDALVENHYSRERRRLEARNPTKPIYAFQSEERATQPAPPAKSVHASLPAVTLRLSDGSMSQYEGAAPQERWLISGVLPLGEPGLVAGDGGIGKSFLALDLCFRIATGVPSAGPLDLSGETFGGQIAEYGSAAYITAEESKPALHKRLVAIDPHNHRRGNNRLYAVSLRDRPGSRALIRSKTEGYAPSDFARSLLQELRALPDLRLVVLDPVSAFFGGDMIDRTAVQAFCDVLSHIATATGATIIALHHMRKATDEGGDGNRKGILGSGGFVDGFRFAYTLRQTKREEATKIAHESGLNDDHGEIVLGQLVKANGSARGADHVYERQRNGLLQQLPSRIDVAKMERDRRRALLVEAADWYAEYGQPFTKTGKVSGLYSNRHALPPDLRTLPQRELEKLADEAIERSELTVAAAGKEKRQQWLCKPAGKFADGWREDFTLGARPSWEARPW